MRIKTVETPAGAVHVSMRPATKQERDQYPVGHPFRPDHYMVLSIEIDGRWHHAAAGLTNESVYKYMSGKPYDNVIDNLLRDLGVRLTLGHA